MFINWIFLRNLLTRGLILTCVLLFVVTSAHAGFLYLLNDDETGNRIYGFRVNESTGALTALSGFPWPAMLGGDNHIVSERMFADAANNRLYVLNEVSDTVSAYSVNPATGAITALPFSPITLPTGGYDTLVVHPSGSPLLAANISSTTPFVASFVITPTTATPAMGSPFPFTGTSGFSSEISVDGNYYYVGGNTGTNIAGFSINASSGVLTPLAGSPFPAGASNVLAYAADASGRLFSVDSVDAIRAFTSTDGVLSPVTGNPFISGLTQRRFGMMHPNQNFYIVAGNTGNNVGVFQISGSGAATTVASVPGSPFPTGATTANCLAINTVGTFLYVGNRISRSVTTFAMNPSTGVLTNLGSQPSSTLGTFGAINGIAYVPDGPKRAPFDFDADRKTDIGIVRDAGSKEWWIARSTNGVFVTLFGNTTDVPVPADYTGDGKADIAFWRPSDGYWFVLRSENFTYYAFPFGSSGDIPVPADYDGDGKADPTVFMQPNPNTTFWWQLLSGGTIPAIGFGRPGDKPVPADYDNDGKADIAVFRPNGSSGQAEWWIRRSTAGNLALGFGTATDKAVQGDYTGDGKADVAIWRPSDGNWFILRSEDLSYFAFPWGATGDIPVPGDYDGDGTHDAAVFRSGTWFINRSTGGPLIAAFGTAGDRPIPNAYVP